MLFQTAQVQGHSSPLSSRVSRRGVLLQTAQVQGNSSPLTLAEAYGFLATNLAGVIITDISWVLIFVSCKGGALTNVACFRFRPN